MRVRSQDKEKAAMPSGWWHRKADLLYKQDSEEERWNLVEGKLRV
jgi:hypothetical protein